VYIHIQKTKCRSDEKYWVTYTLDELFRYGLGEALGRSDGQLDFVKSKCNASLEALGNVCQTLYKKGLLSWQEIVELFPGEIRSELESSTTVVNDNLDNPPSV
jgi:hypothetical protein